MKQMPSAELRAVAYLLPSFRSCPPLHQEIAALGEAWGRHSRATSPPRWITVDFFTGRRPKSGGEAAEQSGVRDICLALAEPQQLCISTKCQVHHQQLRKLYFTGRRACRAKELCK